MPRSRLFLLAAAVAIGCLAGSPHLRTMVKAALETNGARAQDVADQRPALEPVWAAAAPGRVQPRGGDIHISTTVPGIVRDVLVQVTDRVKAGDLLVRFDDEEFAAKFNAAKAELQVRTRERDAVEANGAAKDRRKAEDDVFAAAEAAFEAQAEFDRLSIALRAGTAAVGEIEKARTVLVNSRDRVITEKANLANLQREAKFPPYNREEAGVIAAQSEVMIIGAAIEKTKLRAPRNSMVMEVTAKQGEVAAAGGDSALVTLGDISRLQVRAEVEERDLQRIATGQNVVVKTETFANRPFDGRVVSVAKALTSPQLSSRGKRGLSDVDILEVIVDLDDGSPLIPGMRVDVLFKSLEQTSKSTATR